MPDETADPARKSAGASVDIDKLEKYADLLEASMAGCYVLKEN